MGEAYALQSNNTGRHGNLSEEEITGNVACDSHRLITPILSTMEVLRCANVETCKLQVVTLSSRFSLGGDGGITSSVEFVG